MSGAGIADIFGSRHLHSRDCSSTRCSHVNEIYTSNAKEGTLAPIKTSPCFLSPQDLRFKRDLKMGELMIHHAEKLLTPLQANQGQMIGH